MLAAEVIRRKRDGNELSQDELTFLVRGITDGSLSDAQVGALAMALFLRGMEPDESVALTSAMTRSGAVLEWDIDRSWSVVAVREENGVFGIDFFFKKRFK